MEFWTEMLVHCYAVCYIPIVYIYYFNKKLTAVVSITRLFEYKNVSIINDDCKKITHKSDRVVIIILST